MTKRTILIGTALTAVFLAGCSSNTAGAPATTSAASSTAGTSSAPSTPATSTTSKTSTSSAESSAETTSAGTGSVIPAELDAATSAWFTNFCTVAAGLGPSITAVSAQPPDKSTPQKYQASLSTQFTAFAELFTGAATAIGSVPAPTIEGGQAFSEALGTALSGIGQTIGTATAQFAATPITDAASVEAAASVVASTVTSAASEMTTTLESFKTKISPEVQAAVEAIPVCAVLKN